MLGVGGGENVGRALGVAVGFRKQGELIGPGGLVFVDAGFHVPGREITAIGARKCSGAETTDGSALPEAVVDVAGVERGLFCAGIGQRRADGTLSRSLGNVVVGARELGKREAERRQARESESAGHKNSSTTRWSGASASAGHGPAVVGGAIV